MHVPCVLLRVRHQLILGLAAHHVSALELMIRLMTASFAREGDTTKGRWRDVGVMSEAGMRVHLRLLGLMAIRAGTVLVRGSEFPGRQGRLALVYLVIQRRPGTSNTPGSRCAPDVRTRPCPPRMRCATAHSSALRSAVRSYVKPDRRD